MILSSALKVRNNNFCADPFGFEVKLGENLISVRRRSGFTDPGRRGQ